MAKLNNFCGKKYNYLTILELSAPVVYKCGTQKRKVVCQCECGEIAIYLLRSVISGRRVSCGCKKEKWKRKIGAIRDKREYALLYGVWREMVWRCSEKGLPDYYGRGISVVPEWESDFSEFYKWALDSGYKNGLELDRHPDNNGNYGPHNCRWATRSENMNNTRVNRMILYNGEAKTMKGWAVFLGLDYGILNNRINTLKWDCKKAIETPIIQTPGAKKVVDTKTGMVYNSIKECAEKNGYNYDTLKRLLGGKAKNKTSFTYQI